MSGIRASAFMKVRRPGQGFPMFPGGRGKQPRRRLATVGNPPHNFRKKLMNLMERAFKAGVVPFEVTL
jgi:hypothetical protein